MSVKKILLASIFTLCLPVAAQAQNVQNNQNNSEIYDNHKVSCQSTNPAECNSSDVNNEQRQIENGVDNGVDNLNNGVNNGVDNLENGIDNGVDNLENGVNNGVDNLENNVDNQDNGIQDLEVPQRTRRTRNERIKSYYAGVSGGVFLPNDGLNIGGGGSVFGGAMFTENIGADLEFLFAFGGLDDGDFRGVDNVDGSYSLLGLYLNPRYEIPFADKYTAFVSPGLGFLRTNININDGAGNEFDGGDTDFNLQVKGGVTFPISENNKGFGQVRIVDFDTVSLEAGVKFGF